MVWFPIFCSKRSSPVAKLTALYRVTPLFIECAPSVAIPRFGRITNREWSVCWIRRRPFSAEVLRQRIWSCWLRPPSFRCRCGVVTGRQLPILSCWSMNYLPADRSKRFCFRSWQLPGKFHPVSPVCQSFVFEWRDTNPMISPVLSEVANFNCVRSDIILCFHIFPIWFYAQLTKCKSVIIIKNYNANLYFRFGVNK